MWGFVSHVRVRTAVAHARRLGLRERHNSTYRQRSGYRSPRLLRTNCLDLVCCCLVPSIQPAQLTQLPLRAQPLNASTPLKTVG